MRLSRTADYAQKRGFSLFATTLTVSPYKNASLINEIALRKAEIIGVSYLPFEINQLFGRTQSKGTNGMSHHEQRRYFDSAATDRKAEVL